MSIAVPEPDLTADQMVARAVGLRGHLRADQAATEQRGRYSEETHRLFTEAGFYRILQPRKFGGYEFDLRTFYRTIIEIARGCPSTGWMLCLGSGHALQLGSSFTEQAQADLFGTTGHFIAPLSVGNVAAARPLRAVDGGYRVSGTWKYSSGVPYATHFMGLGDIDGSDPLDERLAVVPAGQYEVLDDWGDLIGLKGSGSNTVVVKNAFVPGHYVVPWAQVSGDWPMRVDLLPGYEIHGNPMYTGGFLGFAIAELTVTQIGAARAMLDEYEHILRTSTVVSHRAVDPTKRSEIADYQRTFGTALGWVDAAHGAVLRAGEIYMDLAAAAVVAGRAVAAEDHWRLYGMIQTAARLSWDAGELLFRTAGSTAALDGQPMQRYWRDLCGYRTNSVHQFDFKAHNVALARFGTPPKMM
jgi:3-hydroxy-9,10-secoandrosta-1,3,5(10)-triene-9,17-dione monooxygenase